MLGSMITISTMAAAALGNTMADVLGIGSAYYVEKIGTKLGFKQPQEVTPAQLTLNCSRVAANLVSFSSIRNKNERYQFLQS